MLGGWGARDLSVTLCQNRFSVLAYKDEEEYTPYDLDVSVAKPSNVFLEATMKKLGGGETRLLEKLRDYERRGGGIDDVWKSLHKLDTPPLAITWQTGVADCCKWLGVSYGCLKPPTFSESPYLMDQNLVAHPGPTFREAGFMKKRESLAVAWDLARHLWETAAERPVVGYLKPRYAIAGRSKVSEKINFRAKADEGRKFGRTIWMADQHEPLIAGAYSSLALNHLHEILHVVANGFNKFQEDPTRIAEAIKTHNVFVNTDFSDFDDSLGPGHFARAFDILRYMFGVDRGCDNIHDRLLDWLEDEISDSLVVTPTGKVVHVPQGMPSGTGLTAVLDSLANAAMWFETIKALRLKESRIFIQGDDSLLALHGPRGSDGRGSKSWGRRILQKAAQIFKFRFGLQINPAKSKVGNYLEVGAAQPRVPEFTSDRSSQVVGRYRQELRQSLGRPPNFSERFEVLAEEPIGPAPGNTHRWTYLFSGRAVFLSHYFKRDASYPGLRYMSVRPTAEVVVRLLYPEGKCNTLDHHIARLQSAVVENMGNHHVVNRIMHYYYDAWIMKHAGYVSKADVRLAKRDNWLQKRRAWYRRIDRPIDLLEEDHEFSGAWDQFLKSAKKAHQFVFGPTYTEWGRIRALRKGRSFYGLGLTMQRPVTDLDYFSTLNNPSLREALGPLGVGIWSCPTLRGEISSLLLKMFEMPNISRAAPQVALIKTRLQRLRSDFINDF